MNSLEFVFFLKFMYYDRVCLDSHKDSDTVKMTGEQWLWINKISWIV